MKKIFLPLLALCGMVTGFTLASCGGGGAGGNDTMVNLEGVWLRTLTSPEHELTFSKVSGNYFEIQYRFGGDIARGSFLVTEYTPGAEPIIKGSISIAGKNDVRDAGPWFGLPVNYPNAIFSVSSDCTMEMHFGPNAQGTGYMTRTGYLDIWTGNDTNATLSKRVDLLTGEITDFDGQEDEDDEDKDITDDAEPEEKPALRTYFHFENAGVLHKNKK